MFAIVSLPQGVFTGVGTGVKTNLIFFERGKTTKDVWYYEVNGKFTRTKPIKDSDLEDCWKKFEKREISDRSWVIKLEDIKNYDLSAKNPNGKGDIKHKSPEGILKSIQEKEKSIQKLISDIQKSI